MAKSSLSPAGPTWPTGLAVTEAVRAGLAKPTCIQNELGTGWQRGVRDALPIVKEKCLGEL